MTRCIGSLIGLKPEETERYIALHANPFPGVLRRISRSGLRHYAIFLADGILFSYLEYVGTDFDADMAAIGTDETTRQWWSLTDPMQAPLPERKDGESKREPGFLDGLDVSREDAESIVMQARLKAGWITEAELNPPAEAEAEAAAEPAQA